MKTLNELYTEVMNSDELKNEFLTLKAPEDIVAFAAKHGCTATQDEIKAFFEEKARNSTGELSEDDLAQVAGGKGASSSEAKNSAFSLGLVCLFQTVVSIFSSDCRFSASIKSSKAAICMHKGMDDYYYEQEQRAKKNK